MTRFHPVARIALAAVIGGCIGAVGRTLHILPHWSGFPRPMLASIALWLAFSVYWSVASKDKAPTKSGESHVSRQAHVVAVNFALLILLFPIPGLTRRFLPDVAALQAVGLLVQAAFIALAVSARRHLGSNWSGEVRIARDHELVRSGPYRYVRHPIYTALVGMYIGTAIVSGQIHAIVALAITLLAYWRKIRLEERALSDAFPADHERYRSETWAWIPGVY